MGMFALLAVLSVTEVARAGHLQERYEADRAFAEMIVGLDTTRALSGYFGVEPQRCIEGSESTQLCAWELTSQQERWDAIADMLGTSARVSVVCAIPKDENEPRMKGSCSASPRKSNRDIFKYARGTASEEQVVDRTKERALMQKYEIVANAWLEGARTLTSMTRLMGTLPDRCKNVEGEQRRCVWRLDKKNMGHGTAAMSIGASLRGRVRLDCAFPRNGGPRGDESCTVETGG